VSVRGTTPQSEFNPKKTKEQKKGPGKKNSYQIKKKGPSGVRGTKQVSKTGWPKGSAYKKKKWYRRVNDNSTDVKKGEQSSGVSPPIKKEAHTRRWEKTEKEKKQFSNIPTQKKEKEAVKHTKLVRDKKKAERKKK